MLRRAIAGWLCAALVLACTPSPASASAASLAAKRRAKLAAALELDRQLQATRPLLMDALAKVDEVDAQLQELRVDLQDTEAALSTLDAEISASEAVLNERAVTLYKSGGYDVIEALLSVRSLDDLLTRIDMIAYIQQTDDDLLKNLGASRNQQAYLQGQQLQSESELIDLRAEADARRAVVEQLISQQEATLASVKADIRTLAQAEAKARAEEAAAAATYAGTEDPPVGFNPNTLIADDVYSDSGSMTAAEIQAFLNARSGALKSYRARDHAGTVRSAAEMIAEAATAWSVSPKVILVTLQKEQSLLTDSSPSQRALDWAMGCGKMDSATLIQYQGFGNQIWGGARALARNRSYWRAGISLSIDGNAVYPSNPSTHSLYRYTPHLHGNVLFYRLWWRYFGNPVG